MKDRNIFRNHPLSILTHNRLGIIFLLIGYNFVKDFFKTSLKSGELQSINATNDKAIYVSLGIFGLLLIGFAYEFFMYKNTTIEITENSVIYNRHGIFMRKNVTTPIEHIANINIENNFIDGLFGLKKISMDTNSATSLKATDFSMVVKNEIAVKMKNLINSAKKENDNYIFEDIVDEINDKHIIKDFSKGEIFRHIILSLNVLPIVIAIGGFIATIPTKFVSKLQIALFILAGIFYFVAFFVRKLNTFNDLTVVRKENELEMSYGFLKKEQFSVPINKIQSISCEQSFFARILGYYMYKITVIGIGNSKEESSAVSLYMKENEINSYMEKILPEFEIDQKFENQDKNYKKYVSIYMAIYSMIITPILIYFKYWYVLIVFLALMLISIVVILQFRSIAIFKDRIVFKSGFLSSITNTIYYEKIDTVCVSKNILANILKIEKLKISYKATIGKNTITSGYYKIGYFEKIMEFYKKGEKN